MKKIMCLLLIGLLLGSSALAAVPKLSGSLTGAAKQAVGYLASGEYERIVTLLPFSDVAPGASEWKSFARNFSDRSNIQHEYSVAYWTGSCWWIAVPLQVPSSGSVEVMMLQSADGKTFSGYRYANWARVEKEYLSSDHVVWDREYVGTQAKVYSN